MQTIGTKTFLNLKGKFNVAAHLAAHGLILLKIHIGLFHSEWQITVGWDVVKWHNLGLFLVLVLRVLPAGISFEMVPTHKSGAAIGTRGRHHRSGQSWKQIRCCTCGRPSQIYSRYLSLGTMWRAYRPLMCCWKKLIAFWLTGNRKYNSCGTGEYSKQQSGAVLRLCIQSTCRSRS